MTDREDEHDRWRRESRHRSTLDPTRARPEPWFVGSGKGLMIAVLGACAVLLVARVASLWWMAEAASQWWTHRVRYHNGGFVKLPPEPAGPHGAVPVDDEAAWISTDDYPIESIMEEEQGRTRLVWTIGVDGKVHDCRAVAGGDHPRLVAAGCAALERRALYFPARDAQGRVFATTKTRNVVWRLPEN